MWGKKPDILFIKEALNRNLSMFRWAVNCGNDSEIALIQVYTWKPWALTSVQVNVSLKKYLVIFIRSLIFLMVSVWYIAIITRVISSKETL